MKNMFKKIVCVGLVGLFVLGSVGVAEAKVIQGTKGRSYITYDKIEKSENLEVIKYLKIKNAKVKFKNNTYTVEFKTNKSCKETKKLVKNLAERLHGKKEIEKLFKEYRTYNVKVKAIKGKGHSHSYYIKGHKVIK